MKNPMLIVIVVIVIAVLGVGAVLLLNNNATNSANNAVVPQNVTPTPVTTPNTTGTSSKVDVSISNMSFPGTTTINKGQTVLWTNNDSTAHTVTFDSGNINSGTINVGGTYANTFNTVGTFTYHCNFHPNMTGTIVVQ